MSIVPMATFFFLFLQGPAWPELAVIVVLHEKGNCSRG